MTGEVGILNKNFVRYALVTAGFVASAPALAHGLRWLVTGEPPRWVDDQVERYRQTRRQPGEPMPQVLHELELTRLATEVQRVRADSQPGQLHRVRASTAAYDSALLETCRNVGLEAPADVPPLSDSQRYDVETRLMSAGVHW